jgi:hypothetical protein
MRSLNSRARTLGALLIAGGVAVGCMVVAPLEDLPAGKQTAGGTGGMLLGSGGVSAGTAGVATQAGNGGNSGAAFGGMPGKCTSNADCLNSIDDPYTCRKHDQTCVRLKSASCPLVYGNAAHPNAIVFGAYAPMRTGSDENSVVWAYRLALDEISGDEFGGLPGGPNGTSRPLVMVVCNGESLDVESSMQHLSGDLGVAAILANLQPGDLRRAFETYRNGQIFFLSPIGATSALATLTDQGLMWHMLGQPADFAPSYSKLLELSESYVRRLRGVSERPLRVAMVTTTDAFDSGLANEAIKQLRFNGKNTVENETAGNYRGITIDPVDPQTANVGATIAEYRPDVVISAAGEIFASKNGVLENIETYWAVGDNPPQRPFYILSPLNAGNLTHVQTVIANQMKGFVIDAEAYKRFVGLSAARAPDPTPYNDFLIRLRSRFPSAHPETENYYDAAYFLAYAMYGAGSVAELTGPGIARGMLRLLDGRQTYTVGPAEIGSVFSALSVPSATLTLNGTLGPPNFDHQTGVRVEAGSVFCFERPSDGSTLVALRNQVLRYDLGNKTFVGSFPCFPGFFP